MKDYAPPVLVVYGDAASITAAVPSGDAADTFFDENGNPQPGEGLSIDLCAVPDDPALCPEA